MKKVIVLLIMSIFLVSCGENEVVDQVIEIPVEGDTVVEEQVEDTSNGEVLTEDEINIAIDELFNSLED